MPYKTIVFLLPLFFLNGCANSESDNSKVETAKSNDQQSPKIQSIKDTTSSVNEFHSGKLATASEILAKKEIPILCYHQIRDYKTSDSKIARDYIVPPSIFREQMQTLKDSGYTSIQPEDLYQHLAYGKALPQKPVMLSFDDTDLEQYTVAAPEMEKRGFKGVFFIMTVSLGRPRYMNKEQVKDLSAKGHGIGSHTWDHHNVKKYKGDDWKIQIEKPTAQLEEITGKKIEFFAYPFGLWNKEAIPELQKRGFKAAFQLYSDRDELNPLYTIRRIIITGNSDGNKLIKRIKSAYHLE
jgi:hypothetical protein